MKGGNKQYPNIGVRIDPRSITSARMPESLKVYTGYLIPAFYYLMTNGYWQKKDLNREREKIQALRPYNVTKNKLQSSYWFHSDTFLLEYFRTSHFNFKIYALRIVFFEEGQHLLGSSVK